MIKKVCGLEELKIALNKGEKIVAMIAPSFVCEFSYPEIISQLKFIGFDKVVEVTFGAKMINRLYHEKLKNSKGLLISSVCPGIVETIKLKYPRYAKNLAQIDSPMTAMAKICQKTYQRYKIAFISPCNFKKIEAQNSQVDYVINYIELKTIIPKCKGKSSFDKFYNDYTKIYPVSGGLSKTAHLKCVLKNNETEIIDGIKEVEEFLKKSKKGIKFLDVTYCNGGCIGGPCVLTGSLKERKKKVLKYIETAKHENIPKCEEGIIKRAEGISFKKDKFK